MTWDSLFKSSRADQQYFFDHLLAWQEYEVSEYVYIKKNIGYTLYHESNDYDETDIIPLYDDMDTCSRNSTSDIFQYSGRLQQKIECIFNAICEHGRDMNGTIFIGSIWVIMIPRKCDMNTKNIPTWKHSTCVFKIRKYIPNTKEFCIWYIDTSSRVYKNWQDYLENNHLPKCTMVFPTYGSYESTDRFLCTFVAISVQESPACKITKGILNSIDIGTNIVSVAAGAATVTSMFTPIAPTVLLGAAMVNLVNVGWTLGRCTHNLIDRGLHKQSVAPTSREAVEAWSGIATSTLGVITGGAGSIIAKSVSQGKNVSNVTRCAFNISKIASIGVGIVSIGHKGFLHYQEYRKTKEVNVRDVIAFGTEILFFVGAVVTVELAEEMILNTQERILTDHRNKLATSRQRNAYDRTCRKVEKLSLNNRITENNIKIQRCNQSAKMRSTSSFAGTLSSSNTQHHMTTRNKISTIVETTTSWTKSLSYRHASKFDRNGEILSLLKEFLERCLDFRPTEKPPNVCDFLELVCCLLTDCNPAMIVKVVIHIAFQIISYKSYNDKILEIFHYVLNYIKGLVTRLTGNLEMIQKYIPIWVDEITENFNTYDR